MALYTIDEILVKLSKKECVALSPMQSSPKG